MSFSLPLGPPVHWHPFLHNTKSGTPIHGGYRSLVERDGHMAPPSFHRPTLFFQKQRDRDRYMELDPKLRVLVKDRDGFYSYLARLLIDRLKPPSVCSVNIHEVHYDKFPSLASISECSTWQLIRASPATSPSWNQPAFRVCSCRV